MSIIDDINANTQAIISGKSLVTNAIIEKGGTVDQVGDLPTFYELAEGIESIETGGGAGAGSALGCLPISNLKIVQVSEHLAKITWKNPADPNRAGIQVRTGVGYIPTMPESLSDVIQDYSADVDELELYLDNVSVGTVVGVWVMPVNLAGELQTLRNTGNTGTVEKLAVVDRVLEVSTSDMGTHNSTTLTIPLAVVFNDIGDILVQSTNTNVKKVPHYVDKETGTLVSYGDVTTSSAFFGSTGTYNGHRHMQLVDPATQDIFLSCYTDGASVIYKFNAKEKTLKQIAVTSSSTQGLYNLFLGADGCIYLCATKNGDIRYIKSGEDTASPVTNFVDYSGATSMFVYGGKTYVINNAKALGTIENGVYTPLSVMSVANAHRNDQVLYAYEDGTVILGAYDNYDGLDPVPYFTIGFGITVVNINTGEVQLLRDGSSNYTDAFSRALPLPSGNLLLLGARGRGNTSGDYKSDIAIYNKELNTVTPLATSASDWNYMYTKDKSKIILCCGSQKSYYDDGTSSNYSYRTYPSYGVFDVATETYEQKSSDSESFITSNYKKMIKCVPYMTSDGKIIVTFSVGYSENDKAPTANYSLIYDETTNSFKKLSSKCYYKLAETSVGIFGTAENKFVKFNTTTDDFELVSELSNLSTGYLFDWQETSSHIYFITDKYVITYNKDTRAFGSIVDANGGYPLYSMSGNKYVYNTTKKAYNPVTGYNHDITGGAYKFFMFADKYRTTGALVDPTAKKLLIS